MIPFLSSILLAYEVTKASCCTRRIQMLKYTGTSVEPWSWKGRSPDSGSAAGASLVERLILEIDLQLWTWVELTQGILAPIWNQ